MRPLSFPILLLALLAAATGLSGAVDRNWALVPVAVINPENGLGTGIMFIHRGYPDSGDHVDVLGYATTKGQFETRVEHRRPRWGETAWLTRARAEAFYYPETWFGGGNHPSDGDEQVYVPVGATGLLELGHPLGAGFLARGNAVIRRLEMDRLESADGGPADTAVLGPTLLGYGGGWDGTLGLALEFDSRDVERLPTRGWHAGQRISQSPPGLDYSYGLTETWLAHYAKPHPAWEIAAKGFQETVTGRAPFYAHPYLGDKKLLRGIPEKRLRDRSAQAVQAEARFVFHLALPLIAGLLGDEWQMAAFAGVGRVGEDFIEASRADFRAAAGIGGRLILGKRRLGAARGDLAFSRYGYGIYVDFNQAF